MFWRLWVIVVSITRKVIPNTLKMALAARLLDTQHKDNRARNQPELVGPVFVCDREEYHTMWHDISVRDHSTSEK